MATKNDKLALRKLKRLPDGTVGVIWVDAATGKEIDDIDGYYFENQLGVPETVEEAIVKEEAEPDAPKTIKEYPIAHGGTTGTWESRNRPEGLSNIGKVPVVGGVLGKLDSMLSGVGKALTNGVSRVTGLPLEEEYPDAPKAATIAQDAAIREQSTLVKPAETGLRTTDVSGAESTGLGFAALTESDLEDREMSDRGDIAWNASRNGNEKDPVQEWNNLAPETQGLLSKYANNSPTGATINSGYRSPTYNASIKGAAKDSLHMQGLSFDLDISGMTDEQKTETVQRLAMSGAQTIAAYSGHNALHVNSVRRYMPDEAQMRSYAERNPDFKREMVKNNWSVEEAMAEMQDAPTAMFNKSRSNYAQSPQWFKDGIELAGNWVPKPTDRPDNPFVDEADQETSVPTPAPLQTIARSIINKATDNGVHTDALEKYRGVDLTKASPSHLSAMGYGPQRNDEEMSQVALMAAGEMHPRRLEALVKGDPTARAELANIVATVENRWQSPQLEGQPIGNVLTGSQYNSMLPENHAVRDANYRAFSEALEEGVSDYYTGANPPSMANATHYLNKDIANAKWENYATDTMRQGDHWFSEVNNTSGLIEYGPGETFSSNLPSKVDQIATDRINSDPWMGTLNGGPTLPASAKSTGSMTPDYSFSSQGPSFTSGSDDSGFASANNTPTGGTGSYSSGFGAGDYSYNSGTSGQNDVGSTSSAPSFSSNPSAVGSMDAAASYSSPPSSSSSSSNSSSSKSNPSSSSSTVGSHDAAKTYSSGSTGGWGTLEKTDGSGLF